MQWDEVRRLYPNKWVHLKVLQSHIEQDKRYVDNVAVIGPLENDRDATKTLLECKDDTFVYHTSKPQIIMNIVQKPSLRGSKLL